MALQGYTLPQNRYIEQPVAGAVVPQMGDPALSLPALTDNYANVQGVTDEFINTVGQLKSYAHDMAKSYGIDVTKPDYSQPGGGQPYRTFQELSAKSIMTGGDLKNKMIQNQLMDKGEIEGKWRRVEGADQMLGDISQMGFNIGLDPDVDAVVKRTQTGNFYTERDAQNYNTQVVMKKRNEWQKKADNAKSETEKKYAELQVAALTDAVKETYPGLLIPREGRNKKNYEAEALKEISNTALGRWSPGQYTEDVDSDGNVILISKAKEGQRYGFETRETGTGSKKREMQVPRVIDFWEKRPNGEVWIHFKPSKEGGGKFQPEPERVDDQNPGAVAANFFQSNAHLGNYGTALGQARDLGWTDASGYIDPNSLPYEAQADTEGLSTKDQSVKRGVADYLIQLRTDIDKWSASGTPTLAIKIGDKNLVLKRGYFGGYIEEDGVEQESGMTNKELTDFISNRYKKQISSDQLKKLKTISQTDRLSNETEGAYQLRLLRAKQAKK